MDSQRPRPYCKWHNPSGFWQEQGIALRGGSGMQLAELSPIMPQAKLAHKTGWSCCDLLSAIIKPRSCGPQSPAGLNIKALPGACSPCAGGLCPDARQAGFEQ